MTSLAEIIVKNLAEKNLHITLAESLTGGLVAECIVRVPGASAVLWGSFVSYTNNAKIKMLGISEELIKKHGPVSSPIAIAMAEGALDKSGADLALSITGLAGPDGDGTGVPVGTVWIGLARKEASSSFAQSFAFTGSRNEVREAAASAALKLLLDYIIQ